MSVASVLSVAEDWIVIVRVSGELPTVVSSVELSASVRRGVSRQRNVTVVSSVELVAGVRRGVSRQTNMTPGDVNVGGVSRQRNSTPGDITVGR